MARSRRRSASKIPTTKAGQVAQAPKPVPASESFKALALSALEQANNIVKNVMAMGYKDHGLDPSAYEYQVEAGVFVPMGTTAAAKATGK